LLAAAGSTLRDQRNKAPLTLGYVTLCRRSELVTLLREDLESESDGFGTVTIRRSNGAAQPVFNTGAAGNKPRVFSHYAPFSVVIKN
jgi:integrase